MASTDLGAHVGKPFAKKRIIIRPPQKQTGGPSGPP